jgi:hypothetical protein
MINIRISILILVLLTIAVILFTYNSICGIEVNNSKTGASMDLINNFSSNVSLIPSSTDVNATIVNSSEENLTLPSKEVILDNINWSNYPLIRNPYIHNYEISDPTDVINHRFLYVTIVVEVLDARNESEVLKQLSGIALEEQKILGPDSGPNVWGTTDGVWVYYAAIMPYESDVYARAFH